MALYKSRYSSHALILSLGILSIVFYAPLNADLTSLARADANPPFSPLSFDESWLLTREQLRYKNLDYKQKHDHAIIAISPFAQNANLGKSIKGQPCPLPFTTDCPVTFPPSNPSMDLALGDITGRSNMLALLYGPIPAGNNNTYPGGTTGYLAEAAQELFPDMVPGTINEQQFIDPQNMFGAFSFFLNYRKRGARIEGAISISEDFIIRVQAGVCSIRQVVEARTNLTDTAPFQPTNPNVNASNVDEFLMYQVQNIAQQMNLDIGDQNQASMEEIRFNLCWRHACEMNKDEDNEWSRFLVIPYAEVSGSFSPGSKRKPNQLFAVPFGNNGHPSAGCTTGINFDFYDNIEIGGEIGFTHFFKKDFCDFPVPNSIVQKTIFPFQTNVSVQPGNNWHFSARIAAYHFVENLSMYFQWFVIDHKQDKICLEKPDAAFMPHLLEKASTFKAKMGNLGFNYDVSPNFGIGFLWQIPFSQRGTYRSSTLMGGVTITF